MHGKGRVTALAVSFLALSVSLTTPAGATDRYWFNMFGGDWVETAPSPAGQSWKDPSGAAGLPQSGDNALLVLPYPLAIPGGYTQPVWANYANVPNGEPPALSHVVVEAENILYQKDLPYFPGKYAASGGYNLDLHSNSETVGGSGLAFPNAPGPFAGTPRKGAHVQSAGTNTVDTQLILGGTAGSQGVYQLSGGTLAVGFMEKIGAAGTGTFTQSGGSHTVEAFSGPAFMILGESQTGTGSYTLSGGSLQVTEGEIVGSAGIGTFTQSGGTHTTDLLMLGQQTSGVGTYDLRGGSLQVTGGEIVGSTGTGRFTQSGGTHTTDSLMLSQQHSGRGEYELRGGSLQVTGNITVGKEGIGEFSQYSGSTHNAQDLTIGSVGSGTYDFRGGNLGVSRTVTVGKSGLGLFYQQGSATQRALNADNLVLAEQAGSTGEYRLEAGSVASTPDVNVASNMTIGRGGIATFDQYSGWVQVGQALSLGSVEAGRSGRGTYNLEGGLLTVKEIAGTGGRLNVGHGGTGNFVQTGGDVRIEGVTGVLDIGGYPSGSGTYSITGGTLSTAATLNVANVSVGAESPGAFMQDGISAVTISETLNVMYQPKEVSGIASGYYLGGSGELFVTGRTLVDGYFKQSGGKFEAANLQVNSSSTGDYRGIYEKTGGSLGGSMQIGKSGHGTFDQNRGDSPGNPTDVDTLTLGFWGTGTFNLNHGTLDVRSAAIVGEAGSIVEGGHAGYGVINHNAGTNTVWGDLILGKSEGGKGEYNLKGANSKLVVKGDEIIGSTGTGTFNQNSTVSGDHIVNGNLILGEKDRGSGTYIMDSGKLDVTRNLFLGLESRNSVGNFTLNSGKLTVTGSLTVGAYGYGEFTQNGGEVLAGKLRVGDLDRGLLPANERSTYTLTGGSSVLAVLGSEELGHKGSADFNHVNGSHIISGDLILGSNERSGRSHYRLFDGVLQIDGDLRLGHEEIIFTNSEWIADFEQSGGVNYSNGNVTLVDTRWPEENFGAMYSLSSGATHRVKNHLDVIGMGAAYFLGPDSDLWVEDRISIQDSGYIQNFGTIHANEIINGDVYGAIFNYGDGKIVTTGSTLRNYGTVTMGGAAPTIIGRIENRGTFRATNTAATYDGIFSNDGAYISTGSSNRFKDLTVGTEGYLVGGAHDSFIMNGTFANNSSKNMLWDTSLASLIFEDASSTGYDFQLAGLDLGANPDGFLDNFAWGSLTLAAGEGLRLWDGNDDPGAALYLGVLELLGGTSQLDSILSDFNIYYDANRAGNSWLGGARHALNGQGFLIPVSGGEPPEKPIPEPATLLLLGSGLVGVAGWARRRRN